MGTEDVVQQAEWISPAVSGAMLCISIDSTSHEYDLWTIALGTDSTKKPEGKFYLSLAADGNDVYYTTSATASKTVDDTAVVSAGAAVAFTANAADIIFASTKEQIYIDRTDARYLQVKCASGKTATLRIRLSSCLRPGDTT